METLNTQHSSDHNADGTHTHKELFEIQSQNFETSDWSWYSSDSPLGHHELPRVVPTFPSDGTSRKRVRSAKKDGEMVLN